MYVILQEKVNKREGEREFQPSLSFGLIPLILHISVYYYYR